ncbi:MAG: hypothetical protein K2Y37_07310 [Pirellulales bacterium]|nr:hypothetical protein [Pirellulales bacterium]
MCGTTVLLAVAGPWACLAITAPVGIVAATEQPPSQPDAANADLDAPPLAACDEFMAAFNASDMAAWRRTLNYPHVRLAEGTVVVSQTPDEYEREWDFAEFTRRTGWHHSRYDYKQVVQRAPDKAHVAVRFTRYRADGSKIATYDALYVVTKINGHWGVQIRSTFAPRK